MEDQRREAAEKEAANRRATEAQLLEDAERMAPTMLISVMVRISDLTQTSRDFRFGPITAIASSFD